MKLLNNHIAITLIIFFSLFSFIPKAQTITTIAGNGYSGDRKYNGDSIVASTARLNQPTSVALDSEGNIYIADAGNLRIRKVSAKTGIITTIAGGGGQGYNGDGGLATASIFEDPIGVAIDSKGNVFIADNGNNRIRKIDAMTGIITTAAGNGDWKYAGDGGLATAAAIDVNGVALDISNNIYIIDNNANRIRRVDALTGIITTVAGNGKKGYNGDSVLAINATLNQPSALALDSLGNMYIADAGNYRLRKVDAKTGIITTVAGNGTWYNGNAENSGDGGLATAAGVDASGVALDRMGNVFISAGANNTIRKVDAMTGIISTIAGNWIPGYSGDGGSPLNASLGLPFGLAFDTVGNFYIADANNNRIRKVFAKDNGDSIHITSMIAKDTLNHQKTIIHWQTNTEVNVSYFEIQKSQDLLSFATLNILNAKGVDSSYDAQDAFSFLRIYYRLKIVFTDSAIHYYSAPIIYLPITLSSFTATANNKTILINWQTATEPNTSHFIIQHSTDGTSFTNIGTVKAIGSGANSYSYTDNTPLLGIGAYYRLKIVDKDGTVTYSKVVSASLTTNNLQLTTFPNPAKDKVTIMGNHIISVQVIDNIGKVIQTQTLKDATNPTLSVVGLPAGIYHLRIQTTDGKVSGVEFVKE